MTEYFSKHNQNPRRLSPREWLVANEVCSLLDVVAEVTTHIQGSTDTHLGQTMFNMFEVKDVLSGSMQDIRRPDDSCSARAAPTGPTPIGDLTPESEKMRELLLEKMGATGLGEATLKAERISMILDPRRKTCSADHLVNGGVDVVFRAENDVKTVADTFEGAVAGPSASDTAASGEAAARGEPAPKKLKATSVLERRRLSRLANSAPRAGVSVWRGAESTERSALLRRELRIYLAEDEHPEADGFSLPLYWLRRSSAGTCADTGQTIAAAAMPHLALVARLYHGIESTSCQAERHFFALSDLIGALRSSMLPAKVERMMFIRLNRAFVPETRNLPNAVEEKRPAATKCAGKAAVVQSAAAEEGITLML